MLIYFTINWLVFKFLISEKHGYAGFVGWQRGMKDGSDQGSRFRRRTSRLAIFISGFIFYSAVLFEFFPLLIFANTSDAVAASFLCIFSVCFFFYIVLMMPFREQDSFRVNIPRLFSDTIISSILTILCFGTLYFQIGLVFGGETVFPSFLDAIYFSAVTFSTLGFGDFSPTPELRMTSAAEALIGNLHLGMIIGTTLAGLNKSS